LYVVLVVILLGQRQKEEVGGGREDTEMKLIRPQLCRKGIKDIGYRM
jgi:hypothetical protein